MLQVTKTKIYLISNDMYSYNKDDLENAPYFFGNCEQMYDDGNGQQTIARIFTDTKWLNHQTINLGQRVYFELGDKQYNGLIQSHKEYLRTLTIKNFIFDVV